MALLFKTSKVWVVDFLYEGRPRRWLKALGPGIDVPGLMASTLHELYGDRAQLVSVRSADEEEERQYVHDEGPLNAYCPVGPRTVSDRAP